MPIEVIVDSIDAVDESLRDEYVQADDGKFVLKGMAETLQGYVSVDKIETHEKTQGLKSALEKEREQRKEFERRAKELEAQNHGMTEEEKTELETLRAAREKAEEERRRREGEFDTWREEISTKHQTETQAIVQERDQLRGALIEDRISRDIAAACNELGGRSAILEPLIRRAVEGTYEDGKVGIAVHDADGTRMLDDNGQPLSIAGYVEKMSQNKEFADLFVSRQKSGGGSSSDGDGGGSGGDHQDGGTDPDAQKRLKELEAKQADGQRLSASERLEMARLRNPAIPKKGEARGLNG